MISKIIHLCLNSISTKPFELNRSKNDPIIKLIKDYLEIENIFNERKKMGFLYLSRKNVYHLLYDSDKNININSSDNFNLSDLFYLILLIVENRKFVTFDYSLDFIKDFKNDNTKNAFIKSKIIYDLYISNPMRNIYNKKTNLENKFNEFIKNLSNNSLGIIKDLDVYNNEDLTKIIFGKKIDEIYGDIIVALIRTNKIVNYKYSIKLINQLDLENIDITETIFNKLSEILNNNNSVKKSYEINDINKLNDDKDKVTFYYILFKYILKNPIYIYQIQFLLNARKKIISNKAFLDLNNDKIKYIYSFLCDSKFYRDILFKNKNELENGSKSNSSDSKKTQDSRQTVSTFYNEDEIFYPIMKFQKICKNSDKDLNFNSMGFMKQMNNGNIMAAGPGDSITIIKDKDNLVEIKTISYSRNLDRKLTTEEEKYIAEFKKTVNISETINSLHISDSDNIEIIDFSKYALLIYRLNLKTGKITMTKKKDISCKECFGIKKKKGDKNEIEYIAIGENGIVFFNQEFNEINRNKKDFKTSYIGGIKINDKLIALTSNSILPKGEDKLVFYNIEQKEEEQIIEGSFVNNSNGLALVEIKVNETKEYKILICACKNYRQKKNQKNGILVVKPSLENDENLSYKFHNTEEFEVNCICPINQSGDKNNTIYFFAGGLNIESSLPMIKLFKVIYDDESKRSDIAYLQDIEIKKTNEFKGFERSIACMLQNKEDRSILVGTSDGKVYAFSEPNLKYYSEDYEEKLFHLFNKKNALKELR